MINWLLLVAISIELLSVMKVKADYIAVDALENVYTVNVNRITKKTSEDEQFTYNAPASISQADLTNYHKPILYTRDFNQIIILDNKLIEIKTVDLSERGFDKGMIAISSTGNIWFYEAQTSKLHHIDESGKVLETINNSHVPLANSSVFDFYFADGKLYLVDISGVHIFDRLANYIKTISLPDIASSSVYKGIFYYLSKDGVFKMDPAEESSHLIFEIENAKDIVVKGGRLYVCTSNAINIYNLK